MKRATLACLSCPACRGDLLLEDAAPGDPIEHGTLRCVACSRSYPIVRGIPEFFRLDELTGQNRRFSYLYDWLSHVYRAGSKVLLAFLGGEGRRRRELLDRVERGPGSSVLEVSIGPGVNLPYLGRVGQVYGLDISRGQLDRCASYARKRGDDVELFLGTAEQLPFRDHAFDAVFHFGGINFFNDQRRAIEEMIRVAKPGTRIVIGDENERGARLYERAWPGFARLFERRREKVAAPIDLVPPEMQELQLRDIWGGWCYVLEFRTPS